MSRHAKTRRIIDEACAVLTEYHPMTVRQVYYRLVSGQVIKNSRSEYNGTCRAIVAARQEGVIPWDWIEDRLRQPRHVSMWDDLADFSDTAARAYRRDVWNQQPALIECWLEKDALSGVFETVLRPYGITLNVGRGYDGWSSIYNASDRWEEWDNVAVLYFGDFDPSGEDMVRSLRERLAFFGCEPEIVKCALTREDISRYNLPPAFTKKTDTRRAAFVAQHGDISVELDALPIDVLRDRITAEIDARMDLDTLNEVHKCEGAERERLRFALMTLTGEDRS